MSVLFSREKKYQFIKLALSHGLSLHNTNQMMRIIGVASMKGYMNDQDQKILLAIIDKLERFSGLLETKQQAKLRVVKQYSMTGAENRIANFFTTGLGSKLNQPINWTRTGLLKRRVMKKRAETRAGSSLGKIGRTRVIGHKKLNKDIDDLARAFNGLIRAWENLGGGKGARAGSAMKKGAVEDFIGSIRTSVKIKR